MRANISNAEHGADVPQRAGGGGPAPRAIADRAAWLVPAGLILLSALPIAAGIFRLTQLAGGAAVTPANARFFASPLPVVLHVISVTLFSILGAFQFVPRLRRGRRSWHRAAGSLLIPSGLVAALSGLWMAQFYRVPVYDAELVYALRLVFGSAMVVFLLLGAAAIRRRDFTRHGAWMLRGYAIGLGAGTQVLTGLVAALIVDPPTKLSRALLFGVAWVINLGVAEWLIRRRTAPPARAAGAAAAQLP